MGLLKEDPFMDKFKPQAALLADYERAICISKSNLLNRIRFKILFANKFYPGS